MYKRRCQTKRGMLAEKIPRVEKTHFAISQALIRNFFQKIENMDGSLQKSYNIE